MKALVVGAGFAGAVAARELAEAGYEVLVIDERNHIGGNAYDYVNEHGIRVHKYGPHLWHTSNDEVQQWASKFTEWLPYHHWVRALLPSGQTVPLPINAETIETVFSSRFYEWAEKNGYVYFDQDDEPQFLDGPRAAALAFLETLVEHNTPVENSRDHVENSVGQELCDLFFAPYTKKMWGLELEDLPSSVAARIPNNVKSGSTLYFPNDKHQCLPKDGYTEMFKRILDHENITVSLSTKRQELPQFAELEHYAGGYVKLIKGWEEAEFDEVLTSEPIDEYYNCRFGELPWRSIKFHTYSVPAPKLLDAPVVNFTHSGPHTRITEWKQLPGHGTNPHWTTLTVEEPCDYRDNNMERYYPVKTSLTADPNRELYRKYRDKAALDGIEFIGRCGQYVYLDMHQCISSTLATVRKILAQDDQQP
jgi:UDP-galactopyranose mutase